MRGHVERELREWMEEHEYESVKQMQGSMSQIRCPDPAAFERAQYMRRQGHATHSPGRVAIMATHTELDEAQKAWVLHVTHVLQPKRPSMGGAKDEAGRTVRVPVITRVFGASPADGSKDTIAPAVVTESSAVNKVRSERRHALMVPREHGAWGLLLVPMVTGCGIALRESRNLFPFLLPLTAALILFWLRTPIESLLGTSAIRAQTPEERRNVRFVVFYLTTVATLALAMLLWGGRNRALWLMGAVAAVAFAAQALLKNLGRSARRLSEIVGTIG